jgi:hypothetical protein
MHSILVILFLAWIGCYKSRVLNRALFNDNDKSFLIYLPLKLSPKMLESTTLDQTLAE